MNDQAENMRKRYLYRRLILTKKVKLKRKSATGLVGPDCAYHLYSQMPTASKKQDSNSLSEHGEES